MPALFTTSRGSCKRSKLLARELAARFGGELVARGDKTVSSLVKEARRRGFCRIVIVKTLRGNPSGFHVAWVAESDWQWLQKIEIRSVKLCDDFGVKASERASVHEGLFLELFDPPDCESDIEARASDEVWSFFRGEKEVGPRMVRS
ncbi:MAG: hypothetical protein JW834_02465 [Candidatus Diapherotrites archaeon]|nr:hypothetical protein [Candidatus Diapherotrites archaeon]